MQRTPTKRVSLHTLGCKLNQTETATIGRQFEREGYELVGFGEPSDVVVLNTCSVTDRADRECRQLLRRVRRTSPDAFVAVVGCYAQLRPDEIASIPGVNLVAGTAEKFDLLRHVASGKGPGPATILRSDRRTFTEAVSATSDGLERTRAFLKVQDGCDYTCAFCTIPLARGASRSVPRQTVINEAEALALRGYKELVLTGVNTGDYGRKEGESLVTLLRELVGLGAFERIRISSVEPNLLTDELLDYWIGEDILCNHWHIPLQSGSDPVLRRMRRRYGTDWYRDRIDRIHRNVPDAGIGADVIVGFPGETDEYFEETVSFLKDMPLSYLHVFTYSERPWTDAPELTGQVEPRIRSERSERLRALSDRKRRSFHEGFVGRIVQVLTESRDESGRMTGLSAEYVRVAMDDSMIEPNNILPVHIVEAGTHECTGLVKSNKRVTIGVDHAVA